MSRIRNAILAASAGTVGLLGLQALPAGAATVTPPHIVAKPDNVMVNTKTLLVGSRFAPLSTVEVEECSATSWVVPSNPCATTNRIRVHVSAAGTFRHKMTAVVCPSGRPPTPGFSQQCYVGVPTPVGIDVIRLVGATSLVVTGP